MKLTDIDAFKLFLDRFGIAHRPGKGEWQVLQVMTPEFGWQVIHKNKHEQLTIADPLIALTLDFENLLYLAVVKQGLSVCRICGRGPEGHG